MKMANKKFNIKTVLSVIFALIAVVLIGIAVTGRASLIRLSMTKGGEVLDGELPNVEEHISEVPEGEVRYLINKHMFFEDTYSQGSVMLENPESCAYDLKFIIYDGSGEAIYVSPVIKPGQYIERDKLSAIVKSGEYTCSYSAQAYKGENLEGQVTGIVTVTVGQ